MKDRIVQFLVSEKISPAEFADKIGVQRSSMSHILNGRNYPSASFIQKMLQVYPSLNSRWLMIGEGEMNLGYTGSTDSSFSSNPELTQSRPAEPLTSLKHETQTLTVESMEPSLFSNIMSDAEADNFSAIPIGGSKNPIVESVNVNPQQTQDGSSSGSKLDQIIYKAPIIQDVTIPEKEIEQILFFYKDKTFNVYRPS